MGFRRRRRCCQEKEEKEDNAHKEMFENTATVFFISWTEHELVGIFLYHTEHADKKMSENAFRSQTVLLFCKKMIVEMHNNARASKKSVTSLKTRVTRCRNY